MATYVVGDLQGFKITFLELLDRINFNPSSDKLFLAGDLINRGPDSLGTLHEINKLGQSTQSVLGNHDIYLLALYYAPKLFDRPKHEMDDILAAPDLKEIVNKLERMPLAIYNKEQDFFLSHAGLYPMWSIQEGLALADQWTSKFENVKNKQKFFIEMFSNEPKNWNACNSDTEKLRFTLNAFTRMRYLNFNGDLNFSKKGPINLSEKKLVPWFRYQKRLITSSKIIFGHWSSLNITEKEKKEKNIFPTDTGVVWTGRLSALRLDDMKWFQVKNQKL